MNKDPFKEYIKESEPAKRDKGYAWHTAIGLQAVDGLKTSEYLLHTAVRNIEGEISFFGQSDVMKAIDVKASRASDLLKEMVEHGIIEPVSRHGKGKYRFR